MTKFGPLTFAVSLVAAALGSTDAPAQTSIDTLCLAPGRDVRTQIICANPMLKDQMKTYASLSATLLISDVAGTQRWINNSNAGCGVRGFPASHQTEACLIREGNARIVALAGEPKKQFHAPPPAPAAPLPQVQYIPVPVAPPPVCPEGFMGGFLRARGECVPPTTCTWATDMIGGGTMTCR